MAGPSLKLSDRWEEAGKTQNGLSLYVDRVTKSSPSENIVRAWVKTLDKSLDYMDLIEVDCLRLKIRRLESQRKSPAFADHSNEWRFIIPESASEIVSNNVCSDLDKPNK